MYSEERQQAMVACALGPAGAVLVTADGAWLATTAPITARSTVGVGDSRLIMAMDVTLKAQHGGIFVFFAIGKLLWFLVALAAGTVVGALAVIAAKQFVNPKAEAEANAALAHT